MKSVAFRMHMHNNDRTSLCADEVVFIFYFFSLKVVNGLFLWMENVMLQEDNSTTSVVRMLWRPQPYKHIRVGNAFGNQWIGIHSPEVHSRRRNPMLDIKAAHDWVERKIADFAVSRRTSHTWCMSYWCLHCYSTDHQQWNIVWVSKREGLNVSQSPFTTAQCGLVSITDTNIRYVISVSNCHDSLLDASYRLLIDINLFNFTCTGVILRSQYDFYHFF